jgi:hypothetical protein
VLSGEDDQPDDSENEAGTTFRGQTATADAPTAPNSAHARENLF